MRRDLLDRLLTLRTAKQPAALVTDLESGAQALVEADGIAGGLICCFCFDEFYFLQTGSSEQHIGFVQIVPISRQLLRIFEQLFCLIEL